MMTMSVRENAAVSALERFRVGRLLSRRREVEVVGAELRRPRRQGAVQEAVVSALSGGNQQKVVMARALLSQPAILARGRAHAGRRCGRPRRDLPDPARGLRRRRAGRRGVLRRQGTRRSVRSRDRDVARARRRDPQRRRGHRGADDPRRGAVHRRSNGERKSSGSPDGSLGHAAPFLEGDYAPVVILAAGDARARRLHLRPEHADTSVAFNVTSVMLLVGRARLHRNGTDDRPDDRRHRPVGRPTGRVPGGGRFVLPNEEQVLCRAWLSASC